MYLAQWGYLQAALHLGHQGLHIVGRGGCEKGGRDRGKKRVEGARKKEGEGKGEEGERK